MENLLKDKNILVIGAGGLLGSTLVAELLNQKARVIAADINLEVMSTRLKSINVNTQNSNIHLLQCNIV
ncbi:NAD-dependent epimerase/dehydratase family protein, partial [Escherichia coli]|nr:NAD-dependent epimerase/dehydratase family protein [Escherichia coli]